MVINFLDRIENTRPFTEREAWGLFRIVALGEAFGWSLLITGLLIRHYNLPGHVYAVPIAGQIHGLLLLAYFAILLAVYSSLRWPRRRFIMAVLAGILPYGTLVFEQWAGHNRKNQVRQTLLLQAMTSSLGT